MLPDANRRSKRNGCIPSPRDRATCEESAAVSDRQLTPKLVPTTAKDEALFNTVRERLTYPQPVTVSLDDL